MKVAPAGLVGTGFPECCQLFALSRTKYFGCNFREPFRSRERVSVSSPARNTLSAFCDRRMHFEKYLAPGEKVFDICVAELSGYVECIASLTVYDAIVGTELQ